MQQGRRPARVPRRGRRVKRIVRRVELWSVLKLALIFYLCMYAVGLVTMAVLWGFANSAGLVDNVESFANEVGCENWQFDGEQMFRRRRSSAAVLVVAATLLTRARHRPAQPHQRAHRRHPARRHRGGRRRWRGRAPPIPAGARSWARLRCPVPGAIAQSVRAHP